ncbi:MAG: hypothetical protein FWB96_02180 [Defluviitaleaceae bacterium]|nr:hypothetical protein [Defluviitaleaceae bacterium]
MNANNPTYVPAYINTRIDGTGEYIQNRNGLNQQQIAERKLRREVASRVDVGGGLGRAHMAEVARLGGGQVSSMRNNVQTSASQAIQSQTIDVIRELMGREEEGSIRMNVLHRMLEDAISPPANEILSDPSVQSSRQWRV